MHKRWLCFKAAISSTAVNMPKTVLAALTMSELMEVMGVNRYLNICFEPLGYEVVSCLQHSNVGTFLLVVVVVEYYKLLPPL